MKKILLPFIIFLNLTFSNLVKAQTETPPVYSPTGRVNAMITRGDTLIVGGNFTAVGKYTGGGALFTTTSDQPNLNFPKIIGYIFSSTPDGNGGFYVFGSYYRESENTTLPSVRIEHILADNTFEPNFSIPVSVGASVQARILFHNGILYFGGLNVSQIGGQTAGNLSAINVTTKQLLSWVPAVTGTNTATGSGITGIYARGNSLYIIGDFNMVGGVSRLKAASIQIGTGNVRAWNPTPNWASGLTGTYSDLDFYEDKIIIGGGFFNNAAPVLSNQKHNCASVDTTTGQTFTYLFQVSSSSGNINNSLYFVAEVTSLTVHNNILYVFTRGTFDTRITAINLSLINLPTASGVLWTKYFNMIATAKEMKVVGNSLFVVGEHLEKLFITNNDNSQANFERKINDAVKLNITNGSFESWSPEPVGDILSDVTTMTFAGNNLFMGGTFSHINGAKRDGVYMVNSQTDALLPFNLIKNSSRASVHALKIIDNTLYIAGYTLKNLVNQNTFQTSSVVGYNINTGTILNWNTPDLGFAYSLEANNQFVFIGGQLNEPSGGSGRQNLFAIDRNTGVLNSWSPNPNSSVLAMHISNNRLYVGGEFNTISTQTRVGGASYLLPSLSLTNWNPTLSTFGRIRTLFSTSTDNIWIGGYFSSIGGVQKKSFASVNSTTGSVLNTPTPSINSFETFNSIASKGCYLFLGGDVSIVGSTTCKDFMAYDFYNKSFVSTSNLCVDIKDFDKINSTAISKNDVFFGGDFIKINGKAIAPYIGKIRYPASFFDPCGDYVTVESGNWNSPTTWNRGTVPPPSAKVTIKHQVTLTQITSCQSVFEDIGGRVHLNTGIHLNLLKDY